MNPLRSPENEPSKGASGLDAPLVKIDKATYLKTQCEDGITYY